MREIKFRGYAYRDDEWRYGYYITDGVIHEINVLLPDNKTLYGSQIEIESLGQFTGLLDKNGKEIYEGDIIEIDTDVAVIIFEEGSFKAHINNSEIKTASYFWSQIKERFAFSVIGNIYENPDLLK